VWPCLEWTQEPVEGRLFGVGEMRGQVWP